MRQFYNSARSQVSPKLPPVSIDEMMVLCSNGHRMVHTSDLPLTIDNLKVRIAAARNSN